jgi:hypothetical protein
MDSKDMKIEKVLHRQLLIIRGELANKNRGLTLRLSAIYWMLGSLISKYVVEWLPPTRTIT